MRIVGLKVVKTRLSEYIDLVNRGETTLVTDRDRGAPPRAAAPRSHHRPHCSARSMTSARTGDR